MRLGVSPAAAPTPTGIFNQRFAWVAWSASLPAVCPVYLCGNVGLQGLLVVRLPAPFIPHSASLGPATATRVLSAPVPVSAPPTSLDECLFFTSLVSDFLAVRFSVSSGCERRRSVSTYAAILVLLPCTLDFYFIEKVPTKIRNKTRMSASTTSIQRSIRSPSHSDQTRKRNKRHPNWKGGSKTAITPR